MHIYSENQGIFLRASKMKFYQKSIGRNFISVLFFVLRFYWEKNPFTN